MHSVRTRASGSARHEERRNWRSPRRAVAPGRDLGEDRFIADAHFAQLHGIDPARAGQLPISDYLNGVHPEDRALVARSIKHCITHGTEYAEEYRLLMPGGEQRWVFARGRCYKDHHGRPVRFLGAALDLTERKQTEQALRQSQTELQLIINAMPILISYVDHEERFRLNNAAYLDWYGLTPQELYGRTIREVIGEEAYFLRSPYIGEALGRPCSSACTAARDCSTRCVDDYLPARRDGASTFHIFARRQSARNLMALRISRNP